MVRKEYLQYVVISDTHFPYHDEQSFRTVLHFIKDQGPDHVILIGDWVDMYSISRYDKNPLRASQLQKELDSAIDGLQRLRKAAGPETPITYIIGNHEERLQKYLWQHPELHGLRDLELANLLRLNDLGITIVHELLWRETFLFTHGRRTSMYAPRWELGDSGISGMSGHTHRIGVHSQTDRTGVKAWYSIGHMTDEKKAEYVQNPNWQQGLGVVYLHSTKRRFFAEVIPIAEHKFLYGGRIYAPEGVICLKRE